MQTTNQIHILQGNNTIQYNTIQYNTIQYNTIQYNTIQYNTIQYNTIQYKTIQYNTIQYNTIQYNTIQYNTITLLSWKRNLFADSSEIFSIFRLLVTLQNVLVCRIVLFSFVEIGHWNSSGRYIR